MTGIFLQLSRVVPDEYPLTDPVASYLADELGFGRLLDYGVIVPRLQQLYEWSAYELAEPELITCARDGALTYAWPLEDRGVWKAPRSHPVQIVRRVLPLANHLDKQDPRVDGGHEYGDDERRRQPEQAAAVTRRQHDSGHCQTRRQRPRGDQP